jgi:hypothetical protein
MLTLEVLGASYVIDCDDSWSDFLSQLWAPFVARRHCEKEHPDVHISPWESGWALDFSQGWGIADDDPWSLVSELRNFVFHRALEDSPLDLVTLHAAVLERNGSGLLLVGPSGVGKTSLTLELAERGWAYHSDDLAPVLPGSGVVVSLRKPLHVKDPARFVRYRRRWNPSPWVGAPTHGFLLPASAFESPPGGEVKPRHLLFPRFDPSSEPLLEPFSPAQAVAWTGPNLLTHRSNGKGMRMLVRLCRQTDAAAMSYGFASEGADLAERWVETFEAAVYTGGNDTKVN